MFPKTAALGKNLCKCNLFLLMEYELDEYNFVLVYLTWRVPATKFQVCEPLYSLRGSYIKWMIDSGVRRIIKKQTSLSSTKIGSCGAS